MTLPKEDLNLIAQIDARLKHYNLIQPTDTTEGEPNPNVIKFYDKYFEKGKEWKPKVGEWVKDKQDNCGLVKEIKDKDNIVVDNQSPHGGLITISLEFILKPTDKEVETWLVSIAEKKYPVGTKFKNAVSNKEIGITDGDYEYSKENNALYTKDKPNKVSQCIWYNGKWAELAPIETEQPGEKYGVNVGANHSKFEVRIFGIESEEKANKIREAIKQYLSTNKF
jgi:hypothetical protein